MILKDHDLNLGNNNYDIKNDNNFIDCNSNLPNISPCVMITLMGWVFWGFLRILSVFILYIYQAVPGLSWGMLDLPYSLHQIGSLLVAWEVLVVDFRLQFPDQEQDIKILGECKTFLESLPQQSTSSAVGFLSIMYKALLKREEIWASGHFIVLRAFPLLE